MSEPVKQAVRLRLYPSASQAREMRGWIGCCRALWNHLLACQKEFYETGSIGGAAAESTRGEMGVQGSSPVPVDEPRSATSAPGESPGTSQQRGRSTYEAEKRFLSAKQLDQERQRWEKEPGCEWRTAAPSQTRQRVVTELDRALRDFFKSRKGQRAGERLGFPRFKKKRPSGSFYLANTRFRVGAAGAELTRGEMEVQGRGPVSVDESRSATSASGASPGIPHRDGPTRFAVAEGGTVTVSKLGDLRTRGGRAITGRILGARVQLAADRWYVAVQVEAPPPRVYGEPSAGVIGVDVGLKASVARSDGVITEAPRFLRKAEKRLRRLQRRLSASERGSRRRHAKVRAVARLQERIRDKRSDFLHTRSSRIIGKAGTVCIETLNVKGMARGRLAKSVADAAMSELHRQITYKAAWSGRAVVRADRYEPTTKACSDCGQLHDMPLHRRTMRCDCGLEIDRDLNAARNLARIGRAQVGGVTAKPSVSPATDVERGVQAAARAAQPVPLDEASRAKSPIRGRAPGIPARTGELKIAAATSRGPGP